MKHLLNIFLCLLIAHAAMAQTKKQRPVLPADVQIRVALLAAPAEFRDSATVLGYTPEGKLTTLRPGTNDMICLAPNPKQFGVYAYAYPKRLEPFMARGRELTEQGKLRQKDSIRLAEVQSGKLIMPKDATILYGYWGKDEDLVPETGEIKTASAGMWCTFPGQQGRAPACRRNQQSPVCPG